MQAISERVVTSQRRSWRIGLMDQFRNRNSQQRSTNRGLLFFWLILVASGLHATSAQAHEGHAALPTKGSRVEGDAVYLSAEARSAVGLTTADIDLGKLENTFTANARVVMPWKQHAYATTRVSGRIARVLYRTGDRVEAGAVLAEVESVELVTEQLELLQFQAELELAEQTLSRVQKLGTAGIIPENEIATAQTTRLERTSAVNITRQKLLGLGLSEEVIDGVLKSKEPVRSLPVISPISGMVIHGDINIGQTVEPTDHLFEVLDASMLWVQAAVVESQAYRVQIGQTARIRVAGLPHNVFEGNVDYIGQVIDPQTRSLPVWITVRTPASFEGALRPGVFGSVEIQTDVAEDAILCPTKALVTSGAETYVFVEQAPGEYLRKQVVLGMRSAKQVEIKDGVFPGDRVVIDGSRQLATFFVQGVLKLTDEAERNIGLQLSKVQEQQIDQLVTLNATVQVPPDQKAIVSSQISGQIARILVDITQRVERGQVLAELESLEFQDLQLSLLQARAQQELATQLLASARQSRGIIAQQEILRRETDSRKAESELRALEEKLLTLGLTPQDIDAIVSSKTTIRALPLRSSIDGVLTTFDVIPGQVVQASDPLFEVHDLSTVWVRGEVFQQDLAAVSIGQTARVRVVSNPDFLATAQLERSNNLLTGSERVFPIWAELNNSDGQLKSNMLARMSISTGKIGPVLAVPASAVLRDGSQEYVFVRETEADGRFARRAIRTGRRDDRFIEVQQGLKPGEAVAVQGVQELQTAFASIR